MLSDLSCNSNEDEESEYESGESDEDSSDSEEVKSKLFLHPFLPYDKRNDEKFKTIMCSFQLKRKLKSKYKTDSSTIVDYYNNRRANVHINFLSLQKIHNVLVKHFNVYNEEGVLTFSLFSDAEIGLNEKFNVILPDVEYDNDEDSDEEEIELGIEKSREVLKSGISIKFPFMNINKKIIINKKKK